MKFTPLRTLLVLLLGISATFALVRAANSTSLPAPWKHQDIGAISIAGRASVAEGVFTLAGTLDIWGMKDGCHFAWQPLNGDGTIVARVLSVEATQNHAKGGVAIRASLDADAPHASMVDTPTDGAQFLSRVQAAGATTSQKTALNKGKMPYWVKLVRAGDTITGYESADGKEWTQSGTANVKLPATVHIGLVASSHQTDKLCAAAFDHVSITRSHK